MRIIPIFEDRLYSFDYGHPHRNIELEQIFDDWQDPEYLEEFFSANEAALRTAFFGVITVEEAVLSTIDEAIRLEKKLKKLAESSDLTLDELFRPLHKTGFETSGFGSAKAYGLNKPKSWLRIYALKIDEGVYAVTGGAIKLTAKMEEGEHTKEELSKIQRCRAWLKAQGIDDIEGFIELSCE